MPCCNGKVNTNNLLTSDEPTTFLAPVEGFLFSQRLFAAPSGKRYRVSSNDPMIEVLDRDSAFLLSQAKRGQPYLTRVTDEAEIEAYRAAVEEALTAKQDQVNADYESKRIQQEANQESFLLASIYRVFAGESSFEDLQAVIATEVRKGKYSRADVIVDFKEAYHRNWLTLDQVIAELGWTEAKLFAIKTDLLAYAATQATGTDKDFRDFLIELESTTVVTREEIEPIVQGLYADRVIGVRLAKEYGFTDEQTLT